ncbi:hypothetical protein HC928_09945 [bacterium]|nr:hypothetical protein [bacterium]
MDGVSQSRRIRSDYGVRSLDTRANMYIHDILTYPRSFSQSILKRLDIFKGATRAFLPEERDLVTAYEFMTGYGQSVEEARRVAVVLMQSLFHEYPYLRLIVEDRFMERADVVTPSPTQQRLAKLPTFFHQAEVYYVAAHDNSHGTNAISAVINEVIGIVPSVAAVGFVINSIAQDDEPRIMREMPNAVMEGFAENTTNILVSAYDGEGFLLWHRA